MRRRSPRGSSLMGGMIGSGIGGVTACDFSTYWNGTSNVNVPFNETTMLPEVGPTKLTDAWMDTSVGAVVDCTGDWSRELIKFHPDSGTSSNTSFVFWSGVDGSLIQLYNSNLTTMRLRVRTVGGVFVDDCIVAYNTGDAVEGSGSYIERIGNNITLSINGVSDTVSMDLTAGIEIDRMKVTSGSRPLTSDMYRIALGPFGVFEMDRRLWTESDPDGNTFLGTLDSRVLSLVSASSTMRVYPYYDDWNTAFFVSDTLCVGVALLTSGGAFMTSGGTPLTRGVYTVEYLKVDFE